jgi:hypothetical protein
VVEKNRPILLARMPAPAQRVHEAHLVYGDAGDLKQARARQQTVPSRASPLDQALLADAAEDPAILKAESLLNGG